MLFALNIVFKYHQHYLKISIFIDLICVAIKFLVLPNQVVYCTSLHPWFFWTASGTFYAAVKQKHWLVWGPVVLDRFLDKD